MSGPYQISDLDLESVYELTRWGQKRVFAPRGRAGCAGCGSVQCLCESAAHLAALDGLTAIYTATDEVKAWKYAGFMIDNFPRNAEVW